jgi:hypothetical protein
MFGGSGVRDQSTPLQGVVKPEFQQPEFKLTSRATNVQYVPRRVCPSCLSFHQAEHSKPASADHGRGRERKGA